MSQTGAALRKAAMVLVAASSVLGAVLLVWQLVTREQVGALSNGQLAGMLALFVLPGATAAAWGLDRRAAQQARAPGGPEEESLQSPGASARREPMVHRRDARLDDTDAAPGRHRRRIAQGAPEPTRR